MRSRLLIVCLVSLLGAALSHLPSTTSALHGPPAASTGFSLPRPATRAEFDKLLQGANQLQQQTCSWTTSGSCAFPFTSEENLCFAAGFDMLINGRTAIFTSKRTTGLPANFQCPVGIAQYPYQTGTMNGHWLQYYTVTGQFPTQPPPITYSSANSANQAGNVITIKIAWTFGAGSGTVSGWTGTILGPIQSGTTGNTNGVGTDGTVAPGCQSSAPLAGCTCALTLTANAGCSSLAWTPAKYYYELDPKKAAGETAAATTVDTTSVWTVAVMAIIMALA